MGLVCCCPCAGGGGGSRGGWSNLGVQGGARLGVHEAGVQTPAVQLLVTLLAVPQTLVDWVET